MSHPSALTASLIVVAAASVWGLYWWPLHQMEAQGLSGAWALVLINLPAGLLLGLWALVTVRAQWPHRRATLWIGLLTGAGMACYGMALSETSVIRATLLFYLTPIWATLIGRYALGEATPPNRWLAIAMGFVGLAVLVSGKHPIPFNVGDILALLSGIFWAIGAAVIKRAGAIPLAGMTAIQFLVVSGVSLLLGALTGGLPTPPVSALTTALPLGLAVSLGALLPSVILLFWASQRLFPGRVGLLMMSEVVVAITSASLLLPMEQMTPLQWLGAALIVGAGIIEVRPNKQQAL
ncbi:MAG: DMT family transporter [Paracoccaceae bacterium]